MTYNIRSIGIGKSMGKLILIGEHAVVYGMPAIAMPFPKVQAIATVEKYDGNLMFSSNFFKGSLENVPLSLKGIASCIVETLNTIEKPLKNLSITVNSTIPTGRGLGSSSAVAIAVVKSLYSFFEHHLSQKQLVGLVKIAEISAHGNDSGIDTTACLSNYPFLFQDRKKRAPLKIAKPFYIVVADTGINANTNEAVMIVRKKLHEEQFETKEIIKSLGYLTNQLCTAIQDGNINSAGAILSNAQNKLQKLGVSSSEINNLVQLLCNEGALGAKLTGGGLGGCVIGLMKSKLDAKRITKNLKHMGVEKVWYFEVSNNY